MQESCLLAGVIQDEKVDMLHIWKVQVSDNRKHRAGIT